MKLVVRSDNPRTSIYLTYGGTRCVVRNDGRQWEMSRNGDSMRLGMASLRWTEALWRAMKTTNPVRFYDFAIGAIADYKRDPIVGDGRSDKNAEEHSSEKGNSTFRCICSPPGRNQNSGRLRAPEGLSLMRDFRLVCSQSNRKPGSGPLFSLFSKCKNPEGSI